MWGASHLNLGAIVCHIQDNKATIKDLKEKVCDRVDQLISI
jgi:hypothetical protein